VLTQKRQTNSLQPAGGTLDHATSAGRDFCKRK
jgi:hypothetical protein